MDLWTMTQTVDTPPDLKDRIRTVLEARHVGRQDAIKANDLARVVGENTRTVRAAISEMRKDGALILSAVQEPYGYYLAASRKEWQEFRNSNLRPRALDILETDKAMARAAATRWGAPVQLTIFADQPELVA